MPCLARHPYRAFSRFHALSQAQLVFPELKPANQSRWSIGLLGRWLTSLSFLACVLTISQRAFAVENADLVAKLQRAMQAMSTGRFEEAATLYADLVRASPGNPGWRMNLGLALHSAGHFREAIQQFQAVIKQEPRNGSAWMMLGVAHLKSSEPRQAIEPLRRSVKLDPKSTVARLELADALLSIAHPAEAAEQFRFLTEADPHNPKAWQGLGLSYAALSRSAFAELERTAPTSAYCYALAARSFASRSELHTAFNLYKQAVAISPNLLGVHAGLSEIYEKTGHKDWAAVEQERESRTSHPDCSTQDIECEFLAAHYLQAVRILRGKYDPESAYWRSRSYQELSLDAFSRLSRMPESPAIHELMAEAYRIQGQYESSLNEWQEALSLAPQDRRLTQGLAQTLWLNHEYQKAQPLLKELVQEQPRSAELNFQ